MISSLLLIAALASSPSCSVPTRSKEQVREFKRENKCPDFCRLYIKEDGRFHLWRDCGRCQVDHICPLACGGLDEPRNMQWLTAEDNLAKGADCTKCKPTLFRPGCP